ncbi:MAG TPA: hypothetical protein VEU28_01630 [Actinomycetota bacterium]|nr:hypothetical protein [Actinomycetota bacterium]
MSHISDGVLRHMLDEPQCFAESDRAHLESCDKCRSRAAAVVGDAGRAAMLMEGAGKVSADPAAALKNLKNRGLSPLAASSNAPSWRWTGLRSWGALRPALGVALVGLMGLMLVGTGVAGNLIKIFEPDKVVGVPVDLETLNSLPDLRNYGTIAIVQEPDEAAAATLDEAAQRTGLKLLVPADMPGGLGAERIHTLSTGRASFTFDPAKAEAAAKGDDFTLPPALIGSSLFLEAGPVAIQMFGGPADATADKAAIEQATKAAAAPDQADMAGLLSALPDLVIVQMKSPVLSSNGPSVADFRDALLTLPNLSPALKEQIKAIGDPSTTLPLPIPVDMASSEEVDVNGVTGLAIGDNTGFGSGVVWQSGGVVRAVAGPLTQDEVLAIARSMR